MTEMGIMHSRWMIAAIAATLGATIASPIAAEPAKAPAKEEARPADRPDKQPAELLLASSEIRAPGQEVDGQASPPPKRKRAARVTTCRCGSDSNPQHP